MESEKGEKIGYLGPEGSNSEEAARKVGKDQNLIPFSSSELIRALKGGLIQKAVLPFENSLGGSVDWALDALLENNLSFVIEAEVIQPIEHNLIGFGQISDTEIVYSHPQALAQCRKLLTTLNVKTIDTDSTSTAVRIVAEKKDKTAAAIGTKLAADINNVPIILKGINDKPNNETRFIVLGNRQIRTGRDKTSLIFGTKNRPGALAMVLMPLCLLGINMTMLVSRPSKAKLGEYIFFVDIEGHKEYRKIKFALRIIKRLTTFLKVLGSYPKANNF